MLDNQAAGVRAVASGVPAQGRLAEDLPQDGDCLGHVRALGVLVDQLIADPAQSVAGNLVTELLEGRSRLGVAAHRRGDRKYGERQMTPLEGAQHPPQAGSRAVFVQRLHAHVAHRKGLRIDDFRKKDLGGRIAVQHAILRTFLVVQHELHARCARRRASAHAADTGHSP